VPLRLQEYRYDPPRALEIMGGSVKSEVAELTDNLWNEYYKKVSIEGKTREDKISVEVPIPPWAEEKLNVFFSIRGLSNITVATTKGNIRSALRTLAENYGTVRVRDIDEDMIRSMDSFHPEYDKKTFYPWHNWTGRIVALYTGNDPWECRRRYIGGNRVVPQEIEEKYYRMTSACGIKQKSADAELVKIERALTMLGQNYPDFDRMNVTMDDIRKLKPLLVGMSKKQARYYELALGRYMWVLTGYDPVRCCFEDNNGVFLPSLSVRADMSGFRDELNQYVTWSLERGIKPNTIRGYLYKDLMIIELLSEFMPEGWKLQDVSSKDLVKVRTENVVRKESTLKEAMKSFGLLLRYFDNDAYFKAGMRWNVDVDSMYRTWIDRDQWHMLFEEATMTERVIMSLAGGMGLRRAEIAAIKLSDISDGTMLIHGKGHGKAGKVSIKDIPAPVIAILNDYLPYRQSILDAWGDSSEDHLLISDFHGCGKPLGIDAVGDKMRNLGKKHGIKMSTHTLRRLYAITLRDAEYDLDTIRRMMRHTNLNTTLNHYLNADKKKLESANEDIGRMLF